MKLLNSKMKCNLTLLFVCVGLLSQPNLSSSSLLEINSPENKESSIKTASNNDSAKLSNFSLVVNLDEDTAIVEGWLTVDYYNSEDIEVSKIPFHMFPSRMAYLERQGNMTIKNVWLDTGSENEDLSFEVLEVEQIVWITLKESCSPNERSKFVIHFETIMPDGGIDRTNEFGTDIGQNRIFKFAVAYPMLCVYDYTGWNLDPYLDTGDPFYSDMAWFNMTVEVPTGMIVAGTGELIEKEILSESIRYHYRPNFPVRELTFSASRYFSIESEIYADTNISIYYLTKDADLWRTNALEYAVKAFTLYSDEIGKYPYSTFNVVEEFTHFGGMEHPLQVYITSSATYSYLELVIAHETGHQWFYHIIGNDEIETGHIDEGIVCWLTDYYFATYYPERGEFANYDLTHKTNIYYSQYGLPNKINQTIYDCWQSGTDYWHLTYTKSPAIYEKLRNTIGHDAFIAGLKLIYDNYNFKIVWFPEICACFEEAAGEDLSWFFNSWFDNTYLPKYEISNAEYNKKTTELKFTITDLNEPLNSYPYHQKLPIDVYDRNENLLYSGKFWVNGTTSLTIEIDEKPKTMAIIYEPKILAQLKDPSQTRTESSIRSALFNFYFIPIVAVLTISSAAIVYLILKNRFTVKNN